MILIIDNYDSFVYNLACAVEKLGEESMVRRNDKITLEEIAYLKPQAIILSPGPCAPEQAGICVNLIRRFGAYTPILGVCLGHQAIGEAYGTKTGRAAQRLHGKASMIKHNGSGLFQNLDNPMPAGRYHSLIVKLPEKSDLVITATSGNGEIMSMQHKTHPVYGVQFHPESILTPQGLDLIKNFMRLAKDWCKNQEIENHKKSL